VLTLLNAVDIGLVYALVAIGYVLLFGVLRVVNLAYGQLLVVATYAAIFAARAGSGVAWAAALSAAIGAGLLVHYFAVRPLGSVSDPDTPRHLAVVVSTIGAGLVIQYTLIAAVGAQPMRFPQLLPGSSRLSIVVSAGVVATVVFAIVAVATTKTLFGLRVRALASNRALALACGLRPGRDELGVVILTSAIAAVAGVVIASTSSATSPFFGASYGLKALLIVIAGGMGTATGALATGMALGLAEALVTAMFGSQYKDAAGLLMLLIAVVVQRWRHE